MDIGFSRTHGALNMVKVDSSDSVLLMKPNILGVFATYKEASLSLMLVYLEVKHRTTLPHMFESVTKISHNKLRNLFFIS